MGRHFPGLSGKVTYKERQPGGTLKICIATPEIAGLTRNGGIGSTYSNLALTLAAAGHKVTIVYLMDSFEPGVSFRSVVDSYKNRGIKLLRLPDNGLAPIMATKAPSISYLAYQWLKEQDFDVIHFPEWMGLGYYSLLAKHQGLAFLDSTMVVGLHGPNAWDTEGNLEYIESIDTLEREFMERKSVAYADVLFSPTQYMIEWVVNQGWEIPERTYVQPHILPDELTTEIRSEAAKIKELVFFGRLQKRKGLVLFCDALDIISQKGESPPVPVTFMGKQTSLDGRNSGDFITERGRRWPFPVRIISDLDREGALAYLKEDGRLAVIASLVENYPNTVRECCGMGIPFLASGVGGIPECITSEDHERVLFIPRSVELAKKLHCALKEGVAPARSAVDFKSNKGIWIDWYAPPVKDQLSPATKKTGNSDRASSYPLISVCLTTYNRPHLLAQALESLRCQDYPNFEVLLVDDGSDEPDALAFLDQLEPEFQTRGWRIIRKENSYLGAARNNGAKHAQGEYLLFMDDDNYAEPHEISTFVRAASYSGADILTCASKYFSGGAAPLPHFQVPVGVYLPLGAAADVGATRNCFGDANALVRRSTFMQLGGFTEDYGIGWEDFEFFALAVLRNARLEVVPEELFWYRIVPGSMSRSTPPDARIFRIARPYLEALAPDLRGIVRLLQGYHHTRDQLSPVLHYVDQFETMWNSWSWRSLRPVRNFFRRLRRLPPESKPTINSPSDAQQAVRSIKRSITWNVTRPFRALRKLLKRYF
jgi:glycosyltransferase involved in cell wall biosynthesis